MNISKNILKEYWGFSEFRDPQEEIIKAVLEKNDCVALLPTGGGKSICFQIPALAQPGICIVISPLIALMQDQVENLKSKGIKAMTIPSGASQDEVIVLFDNLKFGKFKFLYISPERLQSRFIQQKIKELSVNLIAVDEAHCISEWGHDFRPSYRNINMLRTLKPDVNFIAVTATANKNVLKDISKNLELKSPKIFQKSFFRENLAYQIFKIDDKLFRLKQLFTKTEKPAIVYVNSRKGAEEIASYLKANNFKSSFYHAGLSAVEKQLAFEDWMSEKTPIMVATNAFGMGIDKPNVRLVVHFNLPFSIENYIQESGRAGRNGKKAFAVLLQNEDDIVRFEENIENSIPTLKELKECHLKLYQYFRISLGEMIETPFKFNFLEFCQKYHFVPNKTNTCLKILINNGIISLTQNYSKKSTLQFIASSKQVLFFSTKNKYLEKLINTILRTYGGIFEQELSINEFNIAKKAGITSRQVIEGIKNLEEHGLVEYNRTNSDIELLFLMHREDDISINRVLKEIKLFIKQKREKAKKLIAFIKNNAVCRSIKLLDYFDEKSVKNCGICDVCLTHKNRNIVIKESSILALLTNQKRLTSSEICNALSVFGKERDVLVLLRNLLSNSKIGIDKQNKFYLIL